jgi:phage shock protein A
MIPTMEGRQEFVCGHGNESCPRCVQKALDAEGTVLFVRDEMRAVRRQAEEADKRYQDSLAVERKGYAFLNNELFKMKEELAATRRKLAEAEVERDRARQTMRPDEWKGVRGSIETAQRALNREGENIGLDRTTLKALVRIAQSRAADYKRANDLERTLVYEQQRYDKLSARHRAILGAWRAGWPKLKDALTTLAFRIPERPVMSSHAMLDATLPITIWDAKDKADKAWLRLERLMGKPE